MEEHSSNSLSNWLVALLWGILFFLIFLYAHYLIRGIANPFAPNPFDSLFMANKAIADGGVILIGISLLLGPLAKFFASLRPRVHYRKQIGLIGLFMAALHVYITLFPLREMFSFDWYLVHRVSEVTGYMAIALFILISFTSPEKIRNRLGERRWKYVQRLSYLGILLVAIHILYLGKIGNWVLWFKTFDPVYPPVSLVVTAFIAVVLIVRIVVLYLDRRQRNK